MEMFVAFESVRDHLCAKVRFKNSLLPNGEFGELVDYMSSKPLWMKLTFGTGVVSYLYIRYRWTALNDCGVEVIEPRIVS